MSVTPLPPTQVQSLQALRDAIAAAAASSGQAQTSLGGAAQTAETFEGACHTASTLAEQATFDSGTTDNSGVGAQILAQLGTVQAGQPGLAGAASTSGSQISTTYAQVTNLIQQAQGMSSGALASATQKVVFDLQQAQHETDQAWISLSAANPNIAQGGGLVNDAATYAQAVAADTPGTDVSSPAASVESNSDLAQQRYYDAADDLSMASQYQGEATPYVTSALAVVDGVLTPAPPSSPPSPPTNGP